MIINLFKKGLTQSQKTKLLRFGYCSQMLIFTVTMSSMVRRLIFILTVCAPVLLFDWWTKVLAIDHLKNGLPKYYLGGVIRLLYAENTGAWGSMGSNWSPTLRMLFLIVLPLLVLIGMLIYSIFNRDIPKLDLWSYCFIVSGGLGNLIDRIRFGYVVDMLWMGFDYPYAHTNVFNIADVAIMTGFGLLLLTQYREWKLKKEQSASTMSKV